MPITFPKTWSTGEALKSADTLGNLDAMKNEAQKLDTANVEKANPWITTAHIMQPRYDVTTNITNNVSGVFGGRNNGGTWQNTSYVTRWMMPASFSSDAVQFVPLTCLQIDITRPHTIFFQWWINHQSPRDGDGTDGSTHFFAYKGSPLVPTGMNHRVPEQITHGFSPANSPVLLDGTFNTNGHLFIEGDAIVLNYGIGLSAWSNAGKCQQVAWTISIECFYL
tara:strand:- start:1714 stop:2382 length:669 start_codon:yes stop_codon:yes gene_type:complete